MQKITPHLWYDKEAQAAAEFYTSAFASLSAEAESKVTSLTTLHNTPSGDCDIVSFTLWGHDFMAMSAGPLFKFTPAISFMLNFDPSRDADARTKLDTLWAKLSEGGSSLMPLDKYPFSEHYGWVADKYGLTWQFILTDPKGEPRPSIVSSLLFVSDAYGKAKEAVDFYLSVFKDGPSIGSGRAKLGTRLFYGPGQEPNQEGTVMFSDFSLLRQWFAAMDGGGNHKFNFNEAISLMVSCDTQEEINYYWSKLSIVPQSEQCGWLKDKFGVSWQITSSAMDKMMKEGTVEQMARVTQSLLKMKKINIAKLKEAYHG